MVVNKYGTLGIFIAAVYLPVWADNQSAPRLEELAREVANKGWIVYCQRIAEPDGPYDLFACRPDGSHKINITNTPEFEEAGPRFSADRKKLLYRRYPKGTLIHHDRWGSEGQLVIADANGANPQVMGAEGEFPWASFSPDNTLVACLNVKGIQIYDLQTKQKVRQLPRQGIYQQLFWSEDGKWFCGVANTAVKWTVVRMDAESGEVNIVHSFQSCTPDWFPDSRRIIYSSRPANQSEKKGYGFTQLWMCNGDGSEEQMIFGEDGFHIYGGEISPDCKYVLFSKLGKDGGGSEQSGAPIYLMRLDDAPTIKGKSEDLRKVHPNAKDGMILDLGIKGWEAEWTYAELFE